MLNNEIYFLLIRCFNNSSRLLAQKTASAGLSLLPGQPKILECLWERDGDGLGRSAGAVLWINPLSRACWAKWSGRGWLSIPSVLR